MNFWMLVLFSPFFLACSHNPPLSPSPVQPLEASDYNGILKRNTVKTNEYSGFHQTFQADVTILNSEIRNAVIKQRAHFLEWDQSKYQAERDRAAQEASTYSKFFLRFFSPERDYDDFDRAKVSGKFI